MHAETYGTHSVAHPDANASPEHTCPRANKCTLSPSVFLTLTHTPKHTHTHTSPIICLPCVLWELVSGISRLIEDRVKRRRGGEEEEEEGGVVVAEPQAMCSGGGDLLEISAP